MFHLQPCRSWLPNQGSRQRMTIPPRTQFVSMCSWLKLGWTGCYGISTATWANASSEKSMEIMCNCPCSLRFEQYVCHSNTVFCLDKSGTAVVIVQYSPQICCRRWYTTLRVGIETTSTRPKATSAIRLEATFRRWWWCRCFLQSSLIFLVCPLKNLNVERISYVLWACIIS